MSKQLAYDMIREDIKKAIYKGWVTNDPKTFGEAMEFATQEVMKVVHEDGEEKETKK